MFRFSVFFDFLCRSTWYCMAQKCIDPAFVLFHKHFRPTGCAPQREGISGCVSELLVRFLTADRDITAKYITPMIEIMKLEI